MGLFGKKKTNEEILEEGIALYEAGEVEKAYLKLWKLSLNLRAGDACYGAKYYVARIMLEDPKRADKDLPLNMLKSAADNGYPGAAQYLKKYLGETDGTKEAQKEEAVDAEVTADEEEENVWNAEEQRKVGAVLRAAEGKRREECKIAKEAFRADEVYQVDAENCKGDARRAEKESRKIEEARKAEEERRKAEEARRAEEERRRAEEARKAEGERRKAEEARRAEKERRRAEEARREERRRAEEACKAEEERRKAEEARRAEEEREREEIKKKLSEQPKPQFKRYNRYISPSEIVPGMVIARDGKKYLVRGISRIAKAKHLPCEIVNVVDIEHKGPCETEYRDGKFRFSGMDALQISRGERVEVVNYTEFKLNVDKDGIVNNDITRIDRKTVQYLYYADGYYYFTDLDTYDMISLTEETVRNTLKGVKEDSEVVLLIFAGVPFWVEKE